MRYATLLELYTKLDAIYGGVALLVLFLFSCLLVVDLMPEWKVKPFARTGVTVLAMVEYVGLLLFVGLGSLR